MNIRRAIPGDAAAIHLLISQVAPACAEDFGPSGLANFLQPNTPEKVLARIQDGNCFSLLCEIGSVVVGIITVKNYAKVDQLFVHPEYWRQGIAKALWQQAFAIIRRHTAARVITVRSSTQAVEVYRHFGFELAGPKGLVADISYYPMQLVLT